MATDSDPRSPQRQAEMLARVEQALQTAIEATDRRAEALQQAAAPAPAVDLTEGLERFRQRLRGLGECAARADQIVSAADAELAAGEDALRSWLQAAEAARRKLAG